MNEKLEVNPPASAMATPTDDSADAAYRLWLRQDKCIPSAYCHLSFSSSNSPHRNLQNIASSLNQTDQNLCQ